MSTLQAGVPSVNEGGEMSLPFIVFMVSAEVLKQEEARVSRKVGG